MTRGDEYVDKYMAGERARFVDKVRLPRWMHALLFGGGVLGTAAAVAAGAPLLVPFAVAGASALSWGLLAAIRVVVADDALHLQYGVFGPRIRLADIESTEVVDYQPLRYGGWGIRFGLGGGLALSIPGRGGKAVRIRYRGRLGTRTVEVTSERPDALRAAIETARHMDLAAVRARAGVLDAPARDDVAATESATQDEHVAADNERDR